MRCYNCKEVKDKSAFCKGMYECKPCNRERSRRWYRENKVSHKKRAKKSTKRYSSRNAIKLAELKSKLSCESCGYNKCVAALDFHHPNDDKAESVGTMARRSYAWKAILAEIKKCICLCANCHRELHYRREVQ